MSEDAAAGPLPIRMLHDRVLVTSEDEGERRSGGGILIPATVQLGRRLAWARVAAVGAGVRSVKPDDRVLYDPHDKAEGVAILSPTLLAICNDDDFGVTESKGKLVQKTLATGQTDYNSVYFIRLSKPLR